MKWRSGRGRSWKRLLRWVECRGLRALSSGASALPPFRALVLLLSYATFLVLELTAFRLKISLSIEQSAFAFRLLLFAPIVSTWETCLQDKVRRELLNGKRNRCDMWHGSQSLIVKRRCSATSCCFATACKTALWAMRMPLHEPHWTVRSLWGWTCYAMAAEHS